MRHPEHERSLEEDWLFEAITECYVPLLQTLARLDDENLAFQLVLGLTPSLCEMLRDPLLREHYTAYLERTTALAADVAHRSAASGNEQHATLARFYSDRLSEVAETYHNRWQGDLIAAFAHFQDRGRIEIMASSATHGVLPLLREPPEAARAQIELGCQSYRDCFHRDPCGFWLPECAYTPELDPFLKESGIRWFVVEAHGLYHADPMAHDGLFKPCRTPSGIAVFARDPESSRQVWSAEYGYPGAPNYREFHRDLGFELPSEHLHAYLDGDGLRRFTGLKFHRITGATSDKDLYNPDVAAALAREHAALFARDRASQLQKVEPFLDGEPVAVCAFDAELFGHWWFEGIAFLEEFIRQSIHLQTNTEDGFSLTSPSAYLERNEWLQRIQPSASSWGLNGHLESWLSEENSWLYPHLHEAARELAVLARHAAAGKPSPAQSRCLNQMTRELLLAQASDWAFLMKTGTAREYAEKRTRDHLHRFQSLFTQLTTRQIDETFLAECESRDSLFQKIDWRIYNPHREHPNLGSPTAKS